MDAQEIIGKQQENDWILDPKNHAEQLPDEADSLKKILNSSRVKVLQKRYERHNAKAIISQKTYLNQSKRRIFASTASVIFGAYILYSQGGELKMDDKITWLLSAIEMVLLAATSYYHFILKNSKGYEDWMNSRAAAENTRVNYFFAVTKAKTKQPDDNQLLKLQLEYFRRYMLDVQLNYYDGRGKQHNKHAKKYTLFAAIIVALTTVTTAIVTKLNTVTDPTADTTSIVTLFVFIGAVFAALNSMQSQLSMLGEDQRNARRYESVYYQLLDLSGELDTVREAAEQNNRTLVDDFIARTNEVIALENQEWQTRRERKPKIVDSQV